MMDLLITETANAIIAEADHLTELDQAIGDGDHGLNMKRGMEAVLLEQPKLAGKPPGEMLKGVGMQLVMKVGGASGPLFGHWPWSGASICRLTHPEPMSPRLSLSP